MASRDPLDGGVAKAGRRSWGPGCAFAAGVVVLGVFGTLLFPWKQPLHVPPRPAPVVGRNGWDELATASWELRRFQAMRRQAWPDRKGPIRAASPGYIAAIQPGLARIRAACGLGWCTPSVRGLRAAKLARPWIPEEAVIALRLNADSCARCGDHAGALSNTLDIVELAARAERGCAYTESRLWAYISADAISATAPSIERVPAQALEPLCRRLEGIIRSEQPRIRVAEEERAVTLTWVAQSESVDEMVGLQPWDPDIHDGVKSWAGAKARRLGWKPLRAQYLHQFADYFDAWEHCLAQPAINRRCSIDANELDVDAVSWAFPDDLGRWDLRVARERLLLCALAIRLYRARHGSLPATLQAAGMKADLATDPYSGRPFVYRPRNGRFLLYATGEDGRDDGGKPGKKAGALGTDVGVGTYLGSGSQGSVGAAGVPFMERPFVPRGASRLRH